MPATDQLNKKIRYQLIPRTLIFITCEEFVLLIKGAPDKDLWANQYNGLGGHVERGESVLGAAYRELEEESGLVVRPLRLVGVITVDTGESPGIGIYVLRGVLPEEQCNGLSGKISNREGSLEWIARQDMYRLPLVEDLSTLLPVVMSALPGDAPFSASYAYKEDGQLVIEFDPV